MVSKIVLVIGFIFCFSSLNAQQVPAPAQSQATLISGAKIHVGNGTVIENGAIGFKDGVINYVGSAANVNSNDYPSLIEATGKEIYPGFIALNSRIGMVEINAVRATRDFQEVGNNNANIRAIIGYNTDSKVTPTIRSNGVLLAQIVPSGGRISGLSSAVELDAWNWEDAAYATDEGMRLNWPALFRIPYWRASNQEIKKNKDYDKQVAEVKDFFDQALAYSNQKNVANKNLKFEACRGLFDQSRTLYVHCNRAKQIMSAVTLAKSYNMRVAIVGAADSWMLIDFLKRNDVIVILDSTQRLPSRTDSDIDQPFKTAVALQEAGILYALSHEGAWQQRNLPFQAGQAVGYGLSTEDALSSISLNAAKVLQIDKRVGSIEKGKEATLFISSGDALDMRSCKIEKAFIRGKSINLDNKQKALYRKFSKKYERNK